MHVVAYLRMSDKKQDKSIAEQREEIERYCAARGYVILRWYVDEGISGAENLKRLEFQRLILDAQEKRDFHAVVVWDQDRFSRFDPMEANYYWFILKQAGVRIITVATGELDFSDLGGWLQASVVQHGKAQYLRDLSRNVLRGRLTKARAGKWQANRAPYGYAIVNGGDLVPCESAAIVRRIFTTYADTDCSIWDIAHQLNSEGILSPRGKIWKAASVRGVLRRETYVTGHARQLRTPKGKFNSVVNGEIVSAGDHDGGIGMLVECPPIIDRALWDRTQRNLKRRTRNTAPNRKGKTTVLNGLIVCANCGVPMYARGKAAGKHADPSDRIYWCSTYHHHGVHACTRNLVHEGPLLDYLLPRLQRMFLSRQNLTRLTEAIRQKVNHPAPILDLKALRQRAAALDQDIAAAVRELKRLPDDLHALAVEDLRRLRRERELLQASIDATGVKPSWDTEAAVKRTLAYAKTLQEQIASSDRDQLRHALAQLVDRIEVWFEPLPGRRQTRSEFVRGVVHLRQDSQLVVPASGTAQVGTWPFTAADLRAA